MPEYVNQRVIGTHKKYIILICIQQSLPNTSFKAYVNGNDRKHQFWILETQSNIECGIIFINTDYKAKKLSKSVR